MYEICENLRKSVKNVIFGEKKRNFDEKKKFDITRNTFSWSPKSFLCYFEAISMFFANFGRFLMRSAVNPHTEA